MRFLISFDDGAMTFPEEDFPAVAEASHAVVREAKAAGVWIFGGGILSQQASIGHRRLGLRWPLPGNQGGHRRLLDHRGAIAGGSADVGGEVRLFLSLCPGSARDHVRPRVLIAVSLARANSQGCRRSLTATGEYSLACRIPGCMPNNSFKRMPLNSGVRRHNTSDAFP